MVFFSQIPSFSKSFEKILEEQPELASLLKILEDMYAHGKLDTLPENISDAYKAFRINVGCISNGE